MRAKQINEIPTFDEIYNLLPDEIKDYLDRCADTPQSAIWHPEGDVLIHTKIVYNRAKNIGNLNQALAAIFHDLGKADVTKPSKKHPDRWNAYGHEKISADLIEKYKDWIIDVGGNWEQVYNIVKEHMRIKLFDKMRPVKQEELRQIPWFNEINVFSHLDDMKTLTSDEQNIPH